MLGSIVDLKTFANQVRHGVSSRGMGKWTRGAVHLGHFRAVAAGEAATLCTVCAVYLKL